MTKVAFLGLAFTLCANYPTAPNLNASRHVDRVVVAPDSLVLQVGDIGKATCTPTTGGQALLNPCTWTSRDTLVAKPTSGSQSSQITARKIGKTWVLASVKNRKDSVLVRVVDTTATLKSLTVAPAGATVTVGKTQQYTTSAVWSDGAPHPYSVTWSATGGTITSSGLYTAGPTAGTYKVCATSGALMPCVDLTLASPPPPPSNSISVAPGETWQDKVVANPQGTVFRILAGTHIQQSVVPKAGNQFIGDPGAIMDGQNVTSFAFSGAAANVVIENIEIKRYTGGSSHIGAVMGYDATGWTLLNLNVHDNAWIGANMRGAFTITGGTYHHNGQYGLAVTQATNTSVIDGADLSYNNLAQLVDPLWDAGGIKVSNSNGMTIRNTHSHHNNGPGLWYDINNQNSLIENNNVHDNNYAGIFYEISYNGIIRGNTVMNNGVTDVNHTGSGILVSASSDVEVYSNTVVASNSGGIIALQEDRGSGTLGTYQVRNLSVHNNTVTLPSGKRSGMLDFIGTSDASAMLSSRGNLFNNNNYTITGNTTPFYPGSLAAVSKATWQGFGQDAASSFVGP